MKEFIKNESPTIRKSSYNTSKYRLLAVIFLFRTVLSRKAVAVRNVHEGLPESKATLFYGKLKLMSFFKKNNNITFETATTRQYCLHHATKRGHITKRTKASATEKCVDGIKRTFAS